MGEKECIFCEIASGKIKTDKIYQNEDFIAFYDINPVGEGHTLIIPKKHFNSLMDLDKETLEKYLFAVKEVAKIIIKKYKADGFNIVVNNGKAAGQVIGHVHFHLLPRKEGDNKRGIFIG